MSTKKSNKNNDWRTFVNSSLWYWFQKVIILIFFSFVANHLAASDNFLDNQTYRFPLVGFLFTIIFFVIVSIIAHFNFQFYKKKYFLKKVDTASISRFVASNLVYFTILYIPISFILEILVDGEIQLYYTLIGYIISLLICFVFISLLYTKDIYNLHKISLKDAEITIENGAKITKLTYKNIVCFYSENKIVHTVKSDGSTITTDFTLNELEEKINNQLFFRANRQLIIHYNLLDYAET